MFFASSIVIFMVIGSLKLSPMFTACVLLAIYLLYLISVIREEMRRKAASPHSAPRALHQIDTDHTFNQSTFILGESILSSDREAILGRENEPEPFMEVILKLKKRTMRDTSKGSCFGRFLYFSEWPFRFLM